MSQEPQFKKEDVWAVARAIMEFWYEEVPYGRSACNECRHCDARVDWRVSPDRVEHKKDCPVPVAKDLLTGAPE